MTVLAPLTHANRLLGLAPWVQPDIRVLMHRLPSTSAANAPWTFEQKLSAWQAVMNTHGVLA